jgi:YD repeat-containing protein
MRLKINKKVLICVTIFALVLLFNTSCFAENIIYVYDDLNRLWQEQHEDGTKIIYSYDEVGNRTWKTVGDTTPPNGSITINGGAAYTNSTSVTLALSAADPSGVSQMCISNTTTCSTWETYAASKSWTLTTGDGGKTVYAWFKDTAGNADATPYSNAITLDATAPTNGTLSATAGNTQVSLSWSGFTDATSGIGSYKLEYATGAAPSTCSSGTQIYSGTGTSYTHTGLTNGTTYYYRACAIDNAQNTSSGSTASATPVGGTPPTVTSGSASSITATGE